MADELLVQEFTSRAVFPKTVHSANSARARHVRATSTSPTSRIPSHTYLLAERYSLGAKTETPDQSIRSRLLGIRALQHLRFGRRSCHLSTMIRFGIIKWHLFSLKTDVQVWHVYKFGCTLDVPRGTFLGAGVSCVRL